MTGTSDADKTETHEDEDELQVPDHRGSVGPVRRRGDPDRQRRRYVVTATILVLGTFGAARSAAREEWQELGVSIAIMLVAAASAFAGPRGVWLSNGVGLCVVLVADSAWQARLRRPPRSDT